MNILHSSPYSFDILICCKVSDPVFVSDSFPFLNSHKKIFFQISESMSMSLNDWLLAGFQPLIIKLNTMSPLHQRMVLCQIQKTHEKLKSENKNLLKTNCSHLLCSSEGNVTVKRHRARKTGGGRMLSFEAPPSTLTEGPSCKGLVSWRSLVVVWVFFVVVFKICWNVFTKGVGTKILLNSWLVFVAHVLYLYRPIIDGVLSV